MSADCCTMEMFKPVIMKAPPGKVPDGMKAISLVDPNGRDISRTSPALGVGSFTLWPMSYSDNRVSFGMVMYDPKGKVVGVLEKKGARYVTSVTTSGRGMDGTVTVTGQSNQSVTLTCKEVDGLLKNGGA